MQDAAVVGAAIGVAGGGLADVVGLAAAAGDERAGDQPARDEPAREHFTVRVPKKLHLLEMFLTFASVNVYGNGATQ